MQPWDSARMLRMLPALDVACYKVTKLQSYKVTKSRMLPALGEAETHALDSQFIHAT